MAGYGLKNENGRRVSQRNSQPTNRWIVESFNQTSYSIEKKYFEKLIFKKGDAVDQPKKKCSLLV